jgi:hypothetical protein
MFRAQYAHSQVYQFTLKLYKMWLNMTKSFSMLKVQKKYMYKCCDKLLIAYT